MGWLDVVGFVAAIGAGWQLRTFWIRIVFRARFHRGQVHTKCQACRAEAWGMLLCVECRQEDTDRLIASRRRR